MVFPYGESDRLATATSAFYGGIDRAQQQTYTLEKRLFALVPGDDPNPMHVHHFNYGLILIGAAGLAALFPFGRRALRVLGFAFGFGCGLVFERRLDQRAVVPTHIGQAPLI